MTSTPKLNEALAAAQGEFTTVKKGNKVNAGAIKYSYANLADTFQMALPILSSHGLSFSAQPTLNEHDNFVLAYSLRHASGEEIAGEYPLPKNAKPQEMGSAQTYARRYVFTALVGLASDDDDGQAAANTTVQSNRQARQQRPTSVSLTAYINDNLNTGERKALGENWKADYEFKTSAVPLEKEQECRVLIDSFVGTLPDPSGQVSTQGEERSGVAAQPATEGEDTRDWTPSENEQPF